MRPLVAAEILDKLKEADAQTSCEFIKKLIDYALVMKDFDLTLQTSVSKLFNHEVVRAVKNLKLDTLLEKMIEKYPGYDNLNEFCTGISYRLEDIKRSKSDKLKRDFYY